MILIADSGSTKTHWVLVDNSSIIKKVYTAGINPFYQSQSDVEKGITDQLVPELKDFRIDSIFFYGAGCAFDDKKLIIKNALHSYFRNALIEIESDLLGAARGLLGSRKGIACILGTGSNSCFYDGTQITHNISPLGFILGDEGSGAVLVKQFIADCLKNQVPGDLSSLFLEKYELTPAYILENVYKKPFPNRFLAQFSPFLSENIAHPDIYKLVFNAFVAFFERNVKQYEYENVETSFTGSISYHFRKVLEQAAQHCGVRMGEITQEPMQGLIHYHTNEKI